MEAIPVTIVDAIESLQLPTMPQILLRFLEEAGDEQASMAALAQLVKRDAALTARILTVANSPGLRRGAELKSIKQSLLALGTRLVQTIAACLVVQSVFGRNVDARRYDLAGFWRHSLRVGELARALADKVGYAESEEAYLAGLLHDVGELILLGGLGDRYGALLAGCAAEAELAGAERAELDTDHGAVGAWLVDQWQLPSFMADAILFHHLPAERIASADQLSQIVWAAHTGSLDAEAGTAGDDPGVATVTMLLGVDAESFVTLCRQASERVDLLAAALDVSEGTAGRTLPVCRGPLPATNPPPADLDDTPEAELEATVRGMAALQPLQRTLFSLDSDAEMLLAARESARILFGLGRLAFFLLQPGRSVLSGAGVGGQPALLQRLEIPLEAELSLAAEAALKGHARSSFDTDRPVPVSLIDVQMARAMNSEGLLCVPMVTTENLVGVIVFGISAAQYARTRKRITWLNSFARLTATTIEAWRKMRDRDEQIEAAVVGRFRLQARKAAHEAGNPLGIIKNYLKLIVQKLPDDSELGEGIVILREEIDRVAQIVRQLSEVSTTGSPSGQVNINDLIEGMRALYGESLFEANGIELVLDLAPQIALATADRDSVKQILLNLWKNAAEASPAGSRFVISTWDSVNQNGRFYVEIRLSDSGPGLPAEVMKTLYQPLDASKKPGHAGLGLSIVATLVEKLGGYITCQSRPSHGTTFVVLLPQAIRSER